MVADMLINSEIDKETMRCKCGCGKLVVNTKFITRLIAAQTIADHKFVMNSWTRCEAHNKAVGGVPDSAHLTGEGGDIAINGSNERYVVLKALMLAGFCRIGIGKGFIHADTSRSLKQNCVWVYD